MATLTRKLDPEAVEATQDALPAGVACAEGAAATAFPLATDAALEILSAGGNAVDAAVAAAWALSVCEPSASGLGGQTTLLLYRADGTVRVIDGHSYAPERTSLDLVSRSQQRNGYRACTVPSTPATLDYARRKYGVLSGSQVLRHAIRIAEEGYRITQLQHCQMRWVAALLQTSAETSKLFLPDGVPLPAGSLFRQPALAATLRRLADDGIEDFYFGYIARQITEDMRDHGGLISEEDLANCCLPAEREALRLDYRGYEVISVPPPGGGLQVLLALRFIEELAPDGFSGDSERWQEAIALAIYSVFREREKYLLRLEDLSPSRKDWLFDRGRIREMIDELTVTKGTGCAEKPISASEEPGDTTHLTVADGQGNVVALTQSIQSLFGAKVANGSLGFLYNNYLRTCPRSPHSYQLGSRCQPRSNCAPTLVLKNGPAKKFPVLALGAAGSRRITSAIVQVASGVIDRGLTLSEAVAAPRVHALLNKRIWIERPAASQTLVEELERKSFKPEIKRALSYRMGCVQGLQWLPGGSVLASADPRRDGAGKILAGRWE